MRYRGVKITTGISNGRPYARGYGQAAFGTSEADAVAKLKPMIRDAMARSEAEERNRPAPRGPRKYRVKLATGDVYNIEAYSLKDARDEANARLMRERMNRPHNF